MNKFLALVCILREENFNRQGVIDYNFLCFRDAISEVFELRLKNQRLLPPLDERLELRATTTVTNGARKRMKSGNRRLGLEEDIDDDDEDEDDEEDVEDDDDDEDFDEEEEEEDAGLNRNRDRLRGRHGLRRNNRGADEEEEDTDDQPNLMGGMRSRKSLNTNNRTRLHPNGKDNLRIV